MKKLIIFLLLPLVLILGAGASAFFFGLLPEGLLGGEKVVEEMKDEDTPPPSYEAQGETRAFYMMDEFVANLQTERQEPVFLLLSIAVEIPND
jgi:flagellar FliL protein